MHRVKVMYRRAQDQWVLLCPAGVVPRERRIDASNEDEAYRARDALEQQLNRPVESTDWDTAVEDYEEFHLAFLSAAQQNAFRSARRWLESFYDYDMPAMDDLRGRDLDAWLKEVMKKASLNTARAYWRFIRAFLNWCVDNERMEACPRVRLPRSVGEKKARGRPLTEEEFERMLLVTPRVVGEECAASWQFLLRGLWASSLRLSEAVALHWTDGDIHIDASGDYPMILFNRQKNGRQQRYPITPEFWQMLSQQKCKADYVFSPTLERGGATRNRDTWCHKISAIGRRAGIKMSNGKHATAHDLRRSFMARWRGRVDAATLQLLARHESLQTTKSYYLGDAEANIVAKQIWSEA